MELVAKVKHWIIFELGCWEIQEKVESVKDYQLKCNA